MDIELLLFDSLIDVIKIFLIIFFMFAQRILEIMFNSLWAEFSLH